MPDTIHFDKTDALEAMLTVFWNKGYKLTTTRDLAQSAGLSESSVYNTFGTKRDVFLQALDHYAAKGRRLADRLARSKSALEGLRDYWRFICSESALERNARGCLVTNATLELTDDPELRDRLKRLHAFPEDVFYRTLERAKAQGELSQDADSRALARFLVHSTQGIRVLCRMNPSKAYMRDIAETTLSVLNRYASTSASR